MRTFGLKTLDEYIIFKAQLEEGGYEYKEIHRGSIVIIEWNNLRWQYKKSNDKTKLGSKGFHICKLMREDVIKNLTARNDFDFKRLNALDAHEELFNPVALESHIGHDIWSIDIDDCYWTTLYKLGYINFFLYIKALKKKTWKDGRNASLGSLAAKERVLSFEGKKQIGQPVIVYPDEKLAAVRNHVIYDVWEIFSYIIQALEDDFLMFFKDCVYVKSNKSKDIVVNYLHTKGHKCKIRHHHLSSYNNKTRLAEWWCYEDIEEKDERKLKFYQFTNEQNVKMVITS